MEVCIIIRRGEFHPGHEQKRQLYKMLSSSCTVAFYGKFMGQIYCINHREGTGVLELCLARHAVWLLLVLNFLYDVKS